MNKAALATAAAVVLLGLGGCSDFAKLSELQQTQPRQEGNTHLTTKELLACVIPRWMNTSSKTYSVVQGDQTTVIVPYGPELPKEMVATLVVAPIDGGSHVAYRDMKASTSPQFIARNGAVRACMSQPAPAHE